VPLYNANRSGTLVPFITAVHLGPHAIAAGIGGTATARFA
jgi:hypothetical protein